MIQPISTQYDTDVLVVGGGPVGLSLAGDLGWRGVSALLIEKSDGVIVQPKMDGVNVRTMEFCRRWGITSDVRNCGYPKDFPQDMVYMTSFHGFELGREEFATPSGGKEESRPGNSPETRFRCPQNLFDPILRRFAERQPGVTLRHLTRLVAFEQDGYGVTAQLESIENGARQTVRARYMVGCDGASSTVRKHLDIPMSGLGTLTYTTNVLFHCPDLLDKATIRLGYRYLLIGPEGTWATVVAIDGRGTWRMSLIGSAEKVEYGDADIRAAIERMIGAPMDFTVLSVVPWVRRELMADRYRQGSVFLAGDAAHMTSPTGGFGMNLGIADAVDLAWKLEAVLRGWGGPDLLDSYEIERRPVAQRAVREASGNLLRTLSSGQHPELLASTYASALLRYQLGQRFAATMLREWYKLGIDLGYIYSDSPLVVPDADRARMAEEEAATLRVDGSLSASELRELQRLTTHRALGANVNAPWQELPAQDVMVYRQSSRPGARAPHVWLGDNESTLDWFGRGFVLVDTGAGAATPRLVAAAQTAGLPLTVQRSEAPALRAAYNAPLVLVRPDGHVAWRGSAHDVADEHAAAAIVDRVRGAAANGLQ